MVLDLRRRNKVVYRIMCVSFLIISINQFMDLALYELNIVRESVHENYFLRFTLIPFLTDSAIVLTTAVCYHIFQKKRPEVCMYIINIFFIIFLSNVIIAHCGVQVVYALFFIPIFLSLSYNNKLLTYIMIAMSFTIYLLVVFLYLPTLPKDMYHHTYMDLIATVGMFAGSVFACYAVFDSYNDLMIKTISIHEGYLGIKSHLTQVRQIKHEMRNNFAALKILIDNHEFDKAKEYIATVTKQVSDAIEMTYCDNVFINAILGNFKQTATGNGVHTEIYAEIPEHISIREQDLYSLLTNILDNALAASEHADEKFIKLQIAIKAPYMTIFCVNGCETIMSGGTSGAAGATALQTTKQDAAEHGFGLQIISHIVKKYDGMYNIEQAENTFSITIAVKV